MHISRRVLIAAFAAGGALVLGLQPNIVSSQQLNLAELPFRSAVVSGNLIYLSGTLPTDAAGRVVPGDIKAQTRQTIDNLTALLKESGSSLPQVAAVHVYLRRAEDFPGMNEVCRTYWPKDPPTRTTVIANLIAPEALVEISMIALRNGVERQVVHPAGWMASPNPYSYGIKSGDMLFLAGLVPRNGKDNSPVTGDMTAQVKAVLDNAGEILKAAGMTYQDVVSSRVYITDTAKFQEMNAAYRSYFPTSPPARATVRVGLTSPPYLVEITMTAVKTADRVAVLTPNADGTPGAPNPNLSSAVRVGNRLFVSGMMGTTDSNKGDAAAQTRETMVRIGRTLKAAGFDWSHLVDGVVFLTDLARFGAMNGAYREVFPKTFPARTTVETGLVSPDGLVEIMFTAAK